MTAAGHSAPAAPPLPGTLASDLGPRPEPAPEGSRLETLVLLCQLAGDLLSVPFHLVIFVATRRRHRRRFLAALGRLPDDAAGTLP